MFRLFNMLIQNISNFGSIDSAVMYDEDFSKVTFIMGNNVKYEISVMKVKENQNA